MRDYINKLAKIIMCDIEAAAKNGAKPIERLGIEVMALNALCNAERVLKTETEEEKGK